MSFSKVIGVDPVILKLRSKTAELGTRIETGLKLAGLKLQRESQKMVPVNFGVLKSSAYTRAVGKGFSTEVSVGYTAFYALFVHESVGMVLKGKPRPNGRGLFWDPQGRAQAKFLETPMRALRPELLAALKKEAGIK